MDDQRCYSAGAEYGVCVSDKKDLITIKLVLDKRDGLYRELNAIATLHRVSLEQTLKTQLRWSLNPILCPSLDAGKTLFELLSRHARDR